MLYARFRKDQVCKPLQRRLWRPFSVFWATCARHAGSAVALPFDALKSLVLISFSTLWVCIWGRLLDWVWYVVSWTFVTAWCSVFSRWSQAQAARRLRRRMLSTGSSSTWRCRACSCCPSGVLTWWKWWALSLLFGNAPPTWLEVLFFPNLTKLYFFCINFGLWIENKLAFYLWH